MTLPVCRTLVLAASKWKIERIVTAFASSMMNTTTVAAVVKSMWPFFHFNLSALKLA